MVVKSVLPAGNLGTAQSGRQWSRGIWHDCPIDAIRSGELQGHVFEFLFDTAPKTPATTEGNFGLFTQFSDTGGFINAGATYGWNMGSDGDNEGVSLRSRVTPFRITRVAPFYKLWYELGMKTSTIADTKHGFLHGLIEDTAFSATVPITAAGAIADKNMVGFRRDEADGDYLDTVYKADGVTAVTVKADASQIAADTYFKSGFVYDPFIDSQIADVGMTGANRYALTYYVNGLPLPDRKQIPSALGTDFPNDVQLCWFFAMLNATASTPGDCTLERVRVVQLFEPTR